jgi:hypothetical protein
MPAVDRASQRRLVALGLLLALIGFGIWILRPVGKPSEGGPDPSAPPGSALADSGPLANPEATSRPRNPSILREAARTAQSRRDWPSPGAYEVALVSRELAYLRELERTGIELQRAAAQTVSGMLEARSAARAAFAGHTSDSSNGAVADVVVQDGPGLPPANLLALPGWKELGELDAPHHPTFQHDARTELTRLGIPFDAHDYLIRFLLESVDEIEALSASAYQAGPRMAEFPNAVTDPTPPEATDPGVLAAWLLRQSTLRILHELGVPVDTHFEQTLLNAGIGTNVLPYRWLEPK